MGDGSVPDGWRKVPFSSLVEVNPRRRLRPGVPASYVDMASVREQARGIIGTAVREFSGSGSRFQKGDTLFARITPCAENRKIAFVDFLVDGAVGFGSTEFIVLGPRPMFADPRFVYYLASWDPIVELAVSRMTGTSGRQRVPEYVFREELYVLAPPLPEQCGIAEILSAVDDAIERTEAVIEQVRRVKQGLAQQLLTRGLPGRHTGYKQSEVGEVPACWELVRLAEVAEDLRYGTSAKCFTDQLGPPVLRIPNVVTGDIDTSDLRYVSLPGEEEERLALRDGDLLVVRTNGNPALCGRSCVFRGLSGRWLYASYLIRIRLRQEAALPDYVHLYLNSEWGREELRGHVRTSAGNYNVSARGLASVRIPTPSMAEQRDMMASLATLDERLGRESHALAELRSLKSALMHVLLTGQVRVRVQDPAPAEAAP